MTYVDVHTHLFHKRFKGEEDRVAQRALQSGVQRIIVNGLEPKSNRAALELSQKHAHLRAAGGIYPLDGIAERIQKLGLWKASFPAPEIFDVGEALRWIDLHLQKGALVAVGECGLDDYWIRGELDAQIEVFQALIDIAIQRNVPLIVHSRRAELKAFEVLEKKGAPKVIFHCFGGKVKWAKRMADAGYYFSIPPVISKDQGFQRMVQVLPLERLLTETDAPYMGPVRGKRNEPSNIPGAVKVMAHYRGISIEDMKSILWKNYITLFESKDPHL